MFLSALILNSDASLNSFVEISAVSFIPGSDVTINFRLQDLEEDLRDVPASGATLDVVFNKTDGTTLTKAASVIDAGDRSMWTVSLTQAESDEIYGGNISFELTEGAVLTKGVISNALQNQSQDC